MKIITANVRPPIPDFRWDWQATWDGWELGDPVGYGETEQEAIDNFKEIIGISDSPVSTPGSRG